VEGERDGGLSADTAVARLARGRKNLKNPKGKQEGAREILLRGSPREPAGKKKGSFGVARGARALGRADGPWGAVKAAEAFLRTAGQQLRWYETGISKKTADWKLFSQLRWLGGGGVAKGDLRGRRTEGGGAGVLRCFQGLKHS